VQEDRYYYSEDVKHVLTVEQVDKALEKGKELESLYNGQKLTTRQITKAIELEKHLSILLNKYTFTRTQITKILELGKRIKPYMRTEIKPPENQFLILSDIASSLKALYVTQKLNKEQIEQAIDIGYSLVNIYDTSKNLGEDLYEKAIITGRELGALYRNHATYFSWNILEKAIDKGEELDDLYKNMKKSTELFNKVLDKGVQLETFYEKNIHNFANKNYEKAIDKGIFLNIVYRHKMNGDNIDKAMKKGEYLNVLYSHQNLTVSQIDLALEMEKNLHELYEHQSLLHRQIKRGIEIGKDIDNLWTYHGENFTKKDIDRLIEKRKILRILQKSRIVSNEQKLKIMDLLGISTETISKSKFLLAVSPDLVFDAKAILDEAVKNKLKENPLTNLVGEYNVPKTPWEEIMERAKKDGFVIKNEQYAYKENKKIKIGYLLSKWNEKPLLRSYQILRSQKTPLPSEIEKLIIKISDDPEDIAMKSTGQRWESCETVGHFAGGGETLTGPHNGWRDDIQANNMIAYLWREGEELPRARVMIRWCNRSDDGTADAYVEQPHTHKDDAKYREIIKKNVIDILRKKGFTGKAGHTRCITPYDFSGYVDTYNTKWNNEPITYNIGDRPEVKQNE
jgi:hypothetical protein